jgi:hypothetical protein
MVAVIVFVLRYEPPERNERHDVSSDDKRCAHGSLVAGEQAGNASNKETE